MIIGIGCDVVEHHVTKQLKWDSDTDLLKNIFSPKELDLYYTQKSIKFLAGRFAAKEAVVKCLQTGMNDGIALAEIQILQGKNGQPEIELTGGAKRISEEMRIDFWHASITHSTECSFAVVVAEQRMF